MKTHHFHTKLPHQKPMLRQIEWWLQNGPNFEWICQKEQSFASNYFIFLKILFQFKNFLYRFFFIILTSIDLFYFLWRALFNRKTLFNSSIIVGEIDFSSFSSAWEFFDTNSMPNQLVTFSLKTKKTIFKIPPGTRFHLGSSWNQQD